MNTFKKTNSNSTNYAAAALLAALGSLAGAGPALAGASPPLAGDMVEPLIRNVQYGDLNLNSSEGAHLLYGRLRNAAKAVCSRFESRDPSRMVRWQACVDYALTAAVRQVNHPAVTALHNHIIQPPIG